MCSELGVSSVRERTFPLGPPNEDGMRNPDKRRWREVGERREGGGENEDPYGLTKQPRNAVVKMSWALWHKMARVTGFR